MKITKPSSGELEPAPFYMEASDLTTRATVSPIFHSQVLTFKRGGTTAGLFPWEVKKFLNSFIEPS